jgi:hypothetical protein
MQPIAQHHGIPFGYHLHYSNGPVITPVSCIAALMYHCQQCQAPVIWSSSVLETPIKQLGQVRRKEVALHSTTPVPLDRILEEFRGNTIISHPLLQAERKALNTTHTSSSVTCPFKTTSGSLCCPPGGRAGASSAACLLNKPEKNRSHQQQA